MNGTGGQVPRPKWDSEPVPMTHWKNKFLRS